jgi:hypothetical protein
MAMQGPKSESNAVRDLALFLALLAFGCLWALLFMGFVVFDTLRQLGQLVGNSAPPSVDTAKQIGSSENVDGS